MIDLKAVIRLKQREISIIEAMIDRYDNIANSVMVLEQYLNRDEDEDLDLQLWDQTHKCYLKIPEDDQKATFIRWIIDGNKIQLKRMDDEYI